MSQPSPLVRPQALLLDFGGVIVQTHKHPDGRDHLAALMHQHLAAAGFDIETTRIRESLDAGITALKYWKNSSSRLREPHELTHREILIDYLVSDLPQGPRELLASEAAYWTSQKNTLLSGHVVRDGIPELLERCRAEGIGLGIVSNAHSGASHREILDGVGLGRYFDVQIYSDEVGIRKPHPGMIHLAVDALGLSPAQCWYVGDTLDRDVVAGRRAGAGGVIITRCHRTDNPPFAIREAPDAVLDTPAGLLELLDAAVPPSSAAAGEDAGVDKQEPGALLIDHGGVISASEKNADDRAAFRDELAALLAPAAGEVPPRELADRVLGRAVTAQKAEKKARRARGDHSEVIARTFWELAAEGESPQVAALLRGESARLMAGWGKAKSRRTMRPGVRELFEYCRDVGRRVVVVTNTVSGVAVRAALADHGLCDLVTAVIASDEFGLRKPDPSIVRAAVAASGADPGACWFLGDKPENDAAGARAAGITHRVLVRYPEGPAHLAASQDAALADGTATHLIDTPFDLIALMRTHDQRKNS